MSLKFKRFDRSPARIFLAVLPIIAMVHNTEKAVMLAVYIAVSLAASSAFFALFGRCFPKCVLRTAYFLWLAVLAQASYNWIHLNPLWIMSLALLIPEDIFSEQMRWVGFKSGLFRAVFFICLLIYIGAAREIFCERLLVWSFYLPVGNFLLLGFAAFMWQNQPGYTERYQEETAP